MNTENNKRNSTQYCEMNLVQDADNPSYEELLESMSTDKYWYKFFIRPCCPAPSPHAATEMTQHLKDDIANCKDFNFDQKSTLNIIVDERLEWYKKLGVAH